MLPRPVLGMAVILGVASETPLHQSQAQRLRPPTHLPARHLPIRDDTSLHRAKTPPSTAKRDASRLIAFVIPRQPQTDQEGRGYLADSGQPIFVHR